jgi:hypothetical protein
MVESSGCRNPCFMAKQSLDQANAWPVRPPSVLRGWSVIFWEKNLCAAGPIQYRTRPPPWGMAPSVPLEVSWETHGLRAAVPHFSRSAGLMRPRDFVRGHLGAMARVPGDSCRWIGREPLNMINRLMAGPAGTEAGRILIPPSHGPLLRSQWCRLHTGTRPTEDLAALKQAFRAIQPMPSGCGNP